MESTPRIRALWPEAIKILEDWLTNKSYIHGDEMSLDDIRYFSAIAEGPKKSFPNVHRWFKAVQSNLAERKQIGPDIINHIDAVSKLRKGPYPSLSDRGNDAFYFHDLIPNIPVAVVGLTLARSRSSVTSSSTPINKIYQIIADQNLAKVEEGTPQLREDDLHAQQRDAQKKRRFQELDLDKGPECESQEEMVPTPTKRAHLSEENTNNDSLMQKLVHKRWEMHKKIKDHLEWMEQQDDLTDEQKAFMHDAYRFHVHPYRRR